MPTPARQRKGGSQTDSRVNRGNLKQKRMREEALCLLGGKCMKCGTSGSPDHGLEFHHRIPEPVKNSYQRLKDALAHPQKFVILCREHHLELHAQRVKKTGKVDSDSFMDMKAVRSLNPRPPKGADLEREDSFRLHFAKGSGTEVEGQSCAKDTGQDE